MLRSVRSVHDYHVRATDGNVGRVSDFLFDDREWVVRYAVIDTGGWLAGRSVLLIPEVLGPPSTEGRALPVELTREQVRNSPDIDTDEPVSRRNELDLFEYYGWSPYWGAGRSGFTPHVVRMAEPERKETAREGNPHLRSVREVHGYSIEATDGRVGHLEDFIVEDERWLIRYLVVDTRKWLPGKRVLVSPEWVDEIRWPDRDIRMQLTKRQIEGSPPYDPNQPVNRQDEVRLYDYYGRPKYWT